MIEYEGVNVLLLSVQAQQFQFGASDCYRFQVHREFNSTYNLVIVKEKRR